MALTSAKATPTVLVPELLSFSPHFLLDDIINIANDGVGRAVDAMEDFLNRWAETRLEREPEWDADKELEQGLVSFQTLLEYHTDIAFDFFEAWSLRNIFALPPDLPLVAPHHKELDLNQPPGREAELLAEIDELWREIEKVGLSCNTKHHSRALTNSPQQKQLKLVLTKAVRVSRRHAKQSQARLDRLAHLQPDKLRVLRTLAEDVGTLHAKVSALPALEPLNTLTPPPPGPGKREWEIGKAGYRNWASTQLVQHAKKEAGSTLEGDSAEPITNEDLSAALHVLEHEGL